MDMFSKLQGNSRFNLLWRIWRAVVWFGRGQPRFEGKDTAISGTPGYQDRMTPTSRFWDQEVREVPVRDFERAVQLIKLSEDPFVASALERITMDVVSSVDGDNTGPFIPSTNKADEPVDELVLEVGRRQLRELWTIPVLNKETRDLLEGGDFFSELAFKFGNDNQICGVQSLPKWEMFRVQTGAGLQGFEQRRYLNDSSPIKFHPAKVLHGRLNRRFLYGRALFEGSFSDAVNLENALNDLASASRQIGLNPIIHYLAENMGDTQRKAYQDDHEQRIKFGPLAHYYLKNGMRMERLSDSDPNLSALTEGAQVYQQRLLMRSHIPAFMMAMETQGGAQDIQSQPALAYARMINAVRQILGDAMRTSINMELAIKGVDPALYDYQIVWPRIVSDVQEDGEPDGEKV